MRTETIRPNRRRALRAFAAFAFAFACLALGQGRAAADPNNPSAGIDFAKLDQQLQDGGLEGWVHAGVPEQGLYVFTWRAPDDFFTSAEFPMVSHVPGVMDKIKTLHRHDKIRVKGKFLQNGAPQRHLYVTEVTLLTAYDHNPPDAYQYSVKLPDDLTKQTELVAKVHAVDGDGHVLVIEYKDVVLPVFVEQDADAATVKGFWRGDKIRLHYVLRKYPSQPDHLSPDPAAPKRLEMLRPLSSLHGKAADLTGTLVMFPKSPEIIFDVYALQITEDDGTVTDYTLVNLDDPAAFQAIRDKLGAVYNANSMHAVNGRNKFVVPNVKVHASGTLNAVSPSQANPQLLLTGADKITLTVQ